MICPNCRSENRNEAKFCNECGLPLHGRIAEMTAAAADDDINDIQEGEVSPSLSNIDADTSDSDSDSEGIFDVDEEVSEPIVQNSGPLDPACVPLVGVKGVDVDEDGFEFDLDAMQPNTSQATRNTNSLKPYTVKTEQEADFSGLDECLVDAGYQPPQSTWRSGGTMEMPRVAGAKVPQQKEFRAPDPREKKHGKARVVAIVLVILVVAGGITAGLTYQMELWGGKIVPDVTGKTQADAVYMLEDKGFSVRVMQVKSDEAEGLVLLMDPAATSRMNTGTEIVIHVAISRTIPEVKGKTKDEAAKLLEQEGFDHVAFASEKSGEPEGTVLSVTPEAGGKVKAVTEISVIVARPYTVPDISGMGYDAAIAAIESESYVPAVSYIYTEEVAEGTLLGTNPAAGEKLAEGSTVTLQIAKSRASELVSAAKDFLGGAGTVKIAGTTYEIISVDSVSYNGNNQTSFTITGAAVTTLDGETVRGSAKQKSGTIAWDDSNKIVSIA